MVRIVGFVVLFMMLSAQGFAQSGASEKKQPLHVIQFTGVVFTPDSMSVIPGVHIYTPISGRGTTSNPYGYFTMPVLEGDSIVFSAVGFKKMSYIIPHHEGDRSLKVIITLQEDITFLNEVEVNPYPTEAMFKEAVLALESPFQQQYDNMNAWLTAEYMRTAYADLPYSANANHLYNQQMQHQQLQNHYQMPSNNLLNPFAWAKFIKSLKEK